MNILTHIFNDSLPYKYVSKSANREISVNDCFIIYINFWPHLKNIINTVNKHTQQNFQDKKVFDLSLYMKIVSYFQLMKRFFLTVMVNNFNNINNLSL
jgi:hypothetical protein